MFFLIDFMNINELEKLPPGSILMVNSQSSNFQHIPPGVQIRLGNTRPEQVALLPLHISHIFITSHTPVDTISSIPKDKILKIDTELGASRLNAISSHTVCLVTDLSQATINGFVLSSSIQRILISAEISQKNQKNLLEKLNVALNNYQKFDSTRKLIIDSLEGDVEPDVVYISKTKVLSEYSALAQSNESTSTEQEDKSPLTISPEEDCNYLMSSTLTFVISQFDNYKKESEQTIAELRQQISTLQQELSQLKPKLILLSSYQVGLTYNMIRKKRAFEEGTDLLKKVFDEEAKRVKKLTNKRTEDTSRTASTLSHNSSLRFLNNRKEDSSQSSPSNPGNDQETGYKI